MRELLKGTEVTWLGHSVVLVQTDSGTTFLIDPFITGNPKFPADFKLPAKIDYILLTHGHGDHLGDAVELAAKYNATVVAIHELAAYVAAKGVAKTIGMNLGGTVNLADVAVTMTDARHSAGTHDEKGTHYTGVPAGFVLTIANGPVLYHAGDTAVFGDMKLIHELYLPDIAILPIGGHYTMGPREAALAVQFLKPKLVLPIHFGTFPPLTGTPEELQSLVRGVEVARVEPGDSL
jgi:L-ascorbate metabolism protein UlaG (beta-lactamase superfamily)